MFTTNHMFARLAIITTTLLITSPSIAAEPQLKGKATIIDNIGVASNISPDGKVATVLLDNLVISSHAALRMPLVVTKTAIVSVPVANHEQPVPMRYSVRGFVDTDPSSRATLIIQAGGKVNVVDLTQAVAAAKNSPPLATKEKREKPESVRSADDFYVSLTGTLPARAAHHVTFFLLVEKDRDEVELGAALHVDSLEVILGP